MRPIVFLHVPKTAGQAIHAELEKAVGGPAHVSPVRVHTQADAGTQMAPGYRLYSGHLDWTEIEQLPRDRFVFTVLRNPRERIGSFYAFLRREAEHLTTAELERPENLGKRRILQESADDYFFGGDQGWQDFVRDHYWNFYTTYFASRQVRGRRSLAHLDQGALIDCATQNLGMLQGVYSTEGLDRLERDLAVEFGVRVHLADRFANVGEPGSRHARWESLLRRFEDPRSAERLADFVALDERLMEQVFSRV